MPRPIGRYVITTSYVYASHGARKFTRIYRSGYIFFVNISPVKCMRKRRHTVETSAFSSEFI